jgi:hypothetical protein
VFCLIIVIFSWLFSWFIISDEAQHLYHAMIERVRATKGRLDFPPAFHIMLYHIRLLIYRIPSLYQELEDYITIQNDELNRKTNASRRKNSLLCND